LYDTVLEPSRPFLHSTHGSPQQQLGRQTGTSTGQQVQGFFTCSTAFVGGAHGSQQRTLQSKIALRYLMHGVGQQGWQQSPVIIVATAAEAGAARTGARIGDCIGARVGPAGNCSSAAPNSLNALASTVETADNTTAATKAAAIERTANFIVILLKKPGTVVGRKAVSVTLRRVYECGINLQPRASPFDRQAALHSRPKLYDR
jgi:hypothetical protein